MAGQSPQARIKKWMECDNYMVAVVEKWNHFARIRQDCFGFADLLACRPNKNPGGRGDICLVQCTSGSNHGARVKKILNERKSEAQYCLLAGFRIAVASTKMTKGKYEMRWQEITLSDFAGDCTGQLLEGKCPDA